MKKLMLAAMLLAGAANAQGTGAYIVVDARLHGPALLI